MSVVAMALIGVLSAALMQMTSATTRESSAAISDASARSLAESALQEAALAIRQGAAGNLGSEAAPLRFGDGIVWTRAERLDEDLHRITATGMNGSGRTTIEGIVRRTTSGRVGSALHTAKKLDIKKEFVVDSYDSSLGTYASQAVNVDASGTRYALSRGDVISNEDIRIKKDARIFGNVAYGPGHKIDKKEGALTDVIAGGVRELEAQIEYSAVTPPASLPPASPKIHIHGDPLSAAPDLTLGPGIIRFESMKIHKDAHVRIIGPATLVVDKKLQLEANVEIDSSGGQVGIFVGEKLDIKKKNTISISSNEPSDFVILVGTKLDKKGKIKKRKVKIAGTFTGILYAPHAHVDFKKETTVFGAVIAYSAKLHKESRIHFDEAIPRTILPFIGQPRMRIVSLYPVELESAAARASRHDATRVLGVDREKLVSSSASWTPGYVAPTAEEYWTEDDFPWADEDWWPDVEDLDEESEAGF